MIVRTCESLAGLRPEDGSVLWSHSTDCGIFKPDCATPLAVGSVVYHTSVLDGTIAVRIEKLTDGSWKAERAYRSGSLSCYTASPIYHEGHLYGLHKDGKVACMEAATGERRWIVRDFQALTSHPCTCPGFRPTKGAAGDAEWAQPDPPGPPLRRA